MVAYGKCKCGFTPSEKCKFTCMLMEFTRSLLCHAIWFCSKGVGAKSLQCTSCTEWVHRCSGVKSSLFAMSAKFIVQFTMYRKNVSFKFFGDLQNYIFGKFRTY